MVWVGRDEDIHSLDQAEVVGDGKRGGNVEVRICGEAAGGGVADFHTIQSSNVVTMNL